MRYPEVTVAVILVIALAGLGYWTVTGYVLKAPAGLDAFASCLTQSGATMYGAYWCPHCANQKSLFGASWSKVNYVECDARGVGGRPDICTRAGIQGYPTWIIKDQRFEGELTLAQLSQASGCALP